MYHPEVIERRLDSIQRRLPSKLQRYSVQDSIDRQDHLASLWSKSKDPPGLTRPLTNEEHHFCLNEILLCTYDYRYWAERYAYLNTKTGQLQRIAFWESQNIALQHIAEGELEAWKRGHGYDNLWDWLKARQLGATQVAQTLIGHRLFFYHNQRAIIASDEPTHSLELSRRLEKIYDCLPWWMKPHREFHVKGVEMFFDLLNCSLIVGHGRKESGGLGQGQTTNVFHFTELPDWENFDMIEEDFLPTVPRHPTSVGLMESTARERNDDWHDHFKKAWSGKSRFRAFFIPYYAEKETYCMTPPVDWEPSAEALKHAALVEEQSPMYCFGRKVRLSEDQLYFWEFTRDDYIANGKLHIFEREYAADHLSCFARPGVSIFSHELMNRMRVEARPYKVFSVLNNAGNDASPVFTNQ